MYKNSWILVANSSVAKIFKAISNTVIEETFTLSNPEGRAKGKEINTDRPGRTFDIQGKGRHHVGTTVSDHEMENFARQINAKLLEIHHNGELAQLFLVASPKFLGQLTSQLDSHLLRLVKQKVSKDLTSEQPKSIRDHLSFTL